MKVLKKILHIDDDTVMRMMVKKSLERSHYNFEVTSCVTASEFLENLPIIQPDLLIIDMIMPVLQGPDLLEKIRLHNNMTPAIFMTGQETVDFQNRQKMEPIIGVIHKPFSPITLGDDIMQLWNSRSIKTD